MGGAHRVPEANAGSLWSRIWCWTGHCWYVYTSVHWGTRTMKKKPESWRGARTLGDGGQHVQSTVIGTIREIRSFGTTAGIYRYVRAQ